MTFRYEEREYETVEELFAAFESDRTWFEKHITIPFHVRLWYPIKDFYYNFLHLPSNLRKWARFVWNDRDWHPQFNLEAFEIKCRAQAKHLDDGSEEGIKNSKEALECAEAIKRIREDEYTDYSKKFDEKYTPDIMVEEYNEKRSIDIEIIKTSITNMNNWWD